MQSVFAWTARAVRGGHFLPALAFAAAASVQSSVALAQCYQVLPLPADTSSVVYTRAIALDVSADGRVVVGEALNAINNQPGDRRAVIWQDNTYQFLDTLVSAHFTAVAVSGDGNYIGGKHKILLRAFRMRRSDNAIIQFPEVNNREGSEVHHMSHDGSVVCGMLGTHLFRWTEAGGFQDLGIPAGATALLSSEISADGNTIVGTFYQNNNTDYIQVIWTPAQGVRLLPFVPGPSGQMSNISQDGQLVVSNEGSGPGFHWRPSLGSTTQLPFGPGGADWEPTDLALNGVLTLGKRITGGNSLYVYHQPTNTVADAWQRAGASGVPLASFPIMFSSDGRIIVATNSDQRAFKLCQPLWTGGNACDTLDFNRDGVAPDSRDVQDYLRVYGGGACNGCGDLDFNNDSVAPDTGDIESLLRVFGGGGC